MSSDIFISFIRNCEMLVLVRRFGFGIESCVTPVSQGEGKLKCFYLYISAEMYYIQIQRHDLKTNVSNNGHLLWWTNYSTPLL